MKVHLGDRETERQRDRETEKNKETKTKRARKTERLRDRETERQRDRMMRRLQLQILIRYTLIVIKESAIVFQFYHYRKPALLILYRSLIKFNPNLTWILMRPLHINYVKLTSLSFTI